MPAQRATLAYHHDNMVPSPEGKSYVQTIWNTEDGITLCYGNTVPTGATEGYAPGCIFQHVDGSGLVDVLYLNVGTYASCDFDSVAGFTQQSAIADAAVTATLTGVDTGTDMTAAQAATIVTDLTNHTTKINAVIAALEAVGILAS